ncbi:kinesin-like protein KIN-1 isoform X3 [Cucurbita moschata]|uniref:Kinesin-like protein n=1 Tax=Cucurbita moschata TaxID=3662 RepID=A0A6J1HC51_CUCMO|nr:kinesin-like protein KIN-1 isoform X3 [Cucurbita moschata]
MSNITVCARFRPLSSKERRDHGDAVCIQCVDSETFIFKDEKAEEFTFNFDRVFYEKSEQTDVYRFLAQPIVQDALNAVNGTIITFGQVEIYMEKVRDLFDLSKDNIQIKESKTQGIMLNGVIEMPVKDPPEALLTLSNGIANRAVGETQMNIASSRSHCIYIFTIQQESTKDKRGRTGKLNLVDLAGSEKVEKTGAEGRVLEEAKTINKSLSALGNVINALTCGPTGRGNHIPYRDSKLTRILQDALGGNSRTALLCCCSPSPTNSSESLSTLRFGARAKHIKTSPRVANEDKSIRELENFTPIKRESREKLLNELQESLDMEHVQILEELFIQNGILFDPCSIEEPELAYEDVTSQTISSLQLALEELLSTNVELMKENVALKARVSAAELHHEPISKSSLQVSISCHLRLFRDWFKSLFHSPPNHYT